MLFFFFFLCSGDHRDLRSFPPRRSSDLGLQPGDEITIGAVVGTKGVYGNQFRQLDTTHLGNSLTTGKDLVFQLDIYQLEGLKVRLAIDPDPDDDGLLTARERELGTDPAKRDTDGDLLPDGWEIAHGLDPRVHIGRASGRERV